ncbi:MAG: L,D-transpeptidase family protein [Anaerolineae bacterium]|nr:L,D-transpeptidase family protein [Anaerolineae bacterium]
MDGEKDKSSEGRYRALLNEGISLARAGQREAARELFRQIIHQDPNVEEAWLWLAWLAGTREESLRYLREAQVLLPESERIAEAVRWAQGEEESVAPSAEMREKEAPLHRAREGQERVSQTLADAREKVRQGTRAFVGRITSLTLPSIRLAGLRRFLIPVLSVLGVGMLFLLAILGIQHARRRAYTVEALVLPTPVVETTPTLPASKRIKSFWVQVDIAWTKQDWDAAIGALEHIRAIDPYNKEARERLAEAHYYRGLKFIQQDELEKASLELDQAIRLNAANEELQKVRRELRLYMDGMAAYWEQDWPRAVENLSKVYQLDPDFRDTKRMLGWAYYQVGIQRQKDEVWDEARDAFRQALELIPEEKDVAARLQQVMDKLIPPKRIEVDLSDKLVTLYENHEPIRVFKCCVGRPSAPTLPGRYQILDKMPMAYASKWDLRMPWWLGIYWAGGSENGFHALPILSNGRTLWRGALGTGCSFGCIVLDTDDAKFLYDWAEKGDVVLIKP